MRSIFMKREPFTSMLATCGKLGQHGGGQFSHVAEMAAFAKSGACALRLLAQREKFFNTPRTGIAAGFVMKLRPLAADFAHVAHDQQARPGQFGQHLDGRLHGVGIGVVGVVDQRQAAPLQRDRQGARAALDRHKR